MKMCPKCNIVKPTTEYGKNKTTADGMSSYCKPCKANALKLARRTEKGVITRMHQSQCDASKKRGHPAPDYTRKELATWLYANGFSQIYNSWVNSGYDKWEKPSCDRLDDTQGYSFSNIRLVVWRDNFSHGHACRVLGIGAHAKSCKVVVRTDRHGVETTYATIQEAAIHNQYTASRVSRYCNGTRKPSDGHRWKFHGTI